MLAWHVDCCVAQYVVADEAASLMKSSGVCCLGLGLCALQRACAPCGSHQHVHLFRPVMWDALAGLGWVVRGSDWNIYRECFRWTAQCPQRIEAVVRLCGPAGGAHHDALARKHDIRREFSVAFASPANFSWTPGWPKETREDHFCLDAVRQALSAETGKRFWFLLALLLFCAGARSAMRVEKIPCPPSYCHSAAWPSPNLSHLQPPPSPPIHLHFHPPPPSTMPFQPPPSSISTHTTLFQLRPLHPISIYVSPPPTSASTHVHLAPPSSISTAEHHRPPLPPISTGFHPPPPSLALSTHFHPAPLPTTRPAPSLHSLPPTCHPTPTHLHLLPAQPTFHLHSIHLGACLVSTYPLHPPPPPTS